MASRRWWRLGGVVPGKFTVTGAKIEFKADTNLANNRLVSVKITPAVQGKNRERLAAAYDFSFRTVVAGMEVSDTIPENHQSEIPINTKITIDFSENVKASSVNAANLTVKNHLGGATIPCQYVTTGKQVVITPDTVLDHNEQVDVVVTIAVVGVDDQKLSSPYPFDFLSIGRTWPNPAVFPVNNAIDVPVDAVITATFDADVDESTVDATSFQVSIAEAP